MLGMYDGDPGVSRGTPGRAAMINAPGGLIERWKKS
jgi:hypothetical protein